VIRWAQVQEKDYLMPVPEQDKLVRKKLKQAALDFIQTKQANEAKTNDLLEGLKHRLESDMAFLSPSPPDHPTARSKEGVAVDYQAIMSDLLRQQRALLHKINKKAEVDEDVIRKHLSLLDLEEEKLRQQFEND
jgi:hypothetical protein